MQDEKSHLAEPMETPAILATWRESLEVKIQCWMWLREQQGWMLHLESCQTAVILSGQEEVEFCHFH